MYAYIIQAVLLSSFIGCLAGGGLFFCLHGAHEKKLNSFLLGSGLMAASALSFLFGKLFEVF